VKSKNQGPKEGERRKVAKKKNGGEKGSFGEWENPAEKGKAKVKSIS